MDHQYGDLVLPPIPLSMGWQPRITPETYVGVQFAMMSLAIVTAVVRTSVRVYKFRRMTIDDVLLVIAMLAHVAAVIIAYHATGLVYWTVYMNMGLVRPMDNYLDLMKAFSVLDNLSNIFAWGSLYIVKISFLVFLRGLVNRVRVIHAYWWVVFTLVILMTPVTMFLGFYICPDFSDAMAVTCGPWVVQRQWVFLVVNCCLDIISDILILSIPVWLLWKVQVSLARKFALGAVLCLSIFMVVIALIRVTLDNTSARGGEVLPDTPWLYFWTNVEGSVAILMVSLTAFRSMLGQTYKTSAYYGSGTTSTAPTSGTFSKARPSRWSGAPMSPASAPEKATAVEVRDSKFGTAHDDASDSDDALLPPMPAATAHRSYGYGNGHGVARTIENVPLSPMSPTSTVPRRADQLPRLATRPATPTSPHMSPRLSSIGRRPLSPGMITPTSSALGGSGSVYGVDPTLSAIRKEITIRTSFEAAAPRSPRHLHSPLVNAQPLRHPHANAHTHGTAYASDSSRASSVASAAADQKEVDTNVV